MPKERVDLVVIKQGDYRYYWMSSVTEIEGVRNPIPKNKICADLKKGDRVDMTVDVKDGGGYISDVVEVHNVERGYL